MADNWPATLPTMMLVDGFAEGVGDPRLISEMDAGPAKMRPRSSNAPDPLQGRMIMTSDQWDDLVEFGRETLLRWSLPFNFPRQPYDGATTVLARFVAGLPNRIPHGTTGAWVVSLNLEVLPT